MPLKLDKCVREVKAKMRKGLVKKTFIRKGKRVKTNPYAICKAAIANTKR